VKQAQNLKAIDVPSPKMDGRPILSWMTLFKIPIEMAKDLISPLADLKEKEALQIVQESLRIGG
jgi:hypothetical protein